MLKNKKELIKHHYSKTLLTLNQKIAVTAKDFLVV